MKKILALILAMILVCSLSACGTTTVIDNTGTSSLVDDILDNLEGIDGVGGLDGLDDLQSALDNISSLIEIPDVDIGGTASENGTASVTTPTQHTHNYSVKTTAGTCTKKGYSVYTCTWGDTYSEELDYAHSYSGYFCTKCQKVNPDKIYDYLGDIIKNNGNSIGAGDEYILTNVTLECDYTNNIIIRKSGYEGSDKFEYKINLTKGTYALAYGAKNKNGNFNAATLTKNTKICSDTELDNYFHTMLALAVSDFRSAGINLTLADLGFKVY